MVALFSVGTVDLILGTQIRWPICRHECMHGICESRHILRDNCRLPLQIAEIANLDSLADSNKQLMHSTDLQRSLDLHESFVACMEVLAHICPQCYGRIAICRPSADWLSPKIGAGFWPDALCRGVGKKRSGAC